MTSTTTPSASSRIAKVFREVPQSGLCQIVACIVENLLQSILDSVNNHPDAKAIQSFLQFSIAYDNDSQ
jgi:hypothetical protein